MGAICSRTKKGHAVAKTVGVEETSPRRPLFDFAERNFEIGAGSRRTGDGENTDIVLRNGAHSGTVEIWHR